VLNGSGGGAGADGDGFGWDGGGGVEFWLSLAKSRHPINWAWGSGSIWLVARS